jgi:hypothetical protein
MKMNQLIPMLPVSNISVSVEFYQNLGFPLSKGETTGAMLRFDEYRIMVDRSINHALMRLVSQSCTYTRRTLTDFTNR